MANKEFQVRHGLVVGNNVLVANVTSNTVSVTGTINASAIQVNGTTIPSGATSNLVFDTVNTAFNVANAAFGSANNVAPQVAPAYNTANAAYSHSNSTYAAVNSAFAVINAAFDSANNVAPQVAPAFNTANGGYSVANAAFGHSNTTYGAVNSAFVVINAAFGVANAAYGNANNLAVSANAYSGAMANSVNAYTTATYVKLTAGQQTITGDLNVTGNLTFLGNSTVISSGQLSVGDSLIYLAANNYSGTDIVDIGFIANYGNTTGANVHTGLVRDATDKQYYLFNAYDREPANNTFVPGSNNMVNAVLVADLNTSNLTLGGANAIVWVSAAYDKANAANVLAYNTGIGANNYAGVMANSANAVAATKLANTSGVTFAGSLYFPGGSKIGLGTTQPSGNVHIIGNDSNYQIALSGTTKGMRVETNSTGTVLRGVDSTIVGSYQPLTLGASVLTFETNGATEAMRITSAGKVGINTTSPKALLDISPLSTNTFSISLSYSPVTNNFDSLTYTGSYAHNDLLFGNFTDASGYAQTAISFGYTADANRKFHIGSANNSTFDGTTKYVPSFTVTSGGNVGIGTTTPAYKLDVNGIIGGTGSRFVVGAGLSAASPDYTFAADSSMGMFRLPNVLGFSVGGTERMRISSAGQIGIGSAIYTTVSPLTVTNVGKQLTLQAYAGTQNNTVSFECIRTDFSSNAACLAVYTNSGTGEQERMRIDDTGRVGIGTNTPSTFGSKLIVSSGYPQLGLNNPSSGSGVELAFYDGGVFKQVIGHLNNTNYLQFGVGGSNSSNTWNGITAMTIDSSGNLLVGTYSAIGNLTVAGATTPLALQQTTSSNTSQSIKLGTYTSANPYGTAITAYTYYSATLATQLAFSTTNGGGTLTEAMRIDSTGNVGIGTGLPAYKLQVNGSFAATTKSFVIDHPTKSGMKLRYGSLEGPENGVYVRGKIDGNIIYLPDYWIGLVDENTITVQLTAIGRSQNPYVVKVSNNIVHIDTENHTQPHCYYTIYGERKDVEKLVVEF